MAITIVATPGATNANSYVTEAELTTWIEDRLRNSAAVAAATSDTKKKALVLATRLLDELVEWDGYPTNAETQALQWPRFELFDQNGWFIPWNAIPTRLKNATCEFACNLIDGDRTAEVATTGIDRIKAGPVELEFSKSNPPSRKVLTDTVIQMVALWGEVEFQNVGYVEAERG
jgi:hypothetical protein